MDKEDTLALILKIESECNSMEGEMSRKEDSDILMVALYTMNH